MACGDWAPARVLSLAALQPHLASHLGLVPLPHLRHHAACRAINVGQAPCPAPSEFGCQVASLFSAPYHPLVTICRVISFSLSGSPTWFSQCLEARQQPHSPPLPMVTICRAIGRVIGTLTSTLVWCHPLTCSTLPLLSHSHWSPSGPTVLSLTAAANTSLPTPAMFHNNPLSAHIIASVELAVF